MPPNSYDQPFKFCPLCATALINKPIDGRNRLSCPQCSFIFWNNPKPVVSVLIHAQNKVLLLQRAHEPLKGYWCLPGGFMEYEETPQAAVMREAKEELGVNVSIEQLIGVYHIDNDPRGMHLDVIYAGSITEQIVLNAEASAWQYFDKDKLPENIAYKHAEAIGDFFIREPNIR